MNILYVHTHDSGHYFSPYGFDVKTPNIQDFADDAVVFNNAHCVSPTCSPSRAALLTGKYPHQIGMLGLSQRGFDMDFSQHLVRFLKKYRYHTVLCGIQHEASWYLEHEKGANIIGYDENLTGDISGYEQEELVHWDYKNSTNASKWLDSYVSESPFFLSFGMYSTHRRYPKEILDSIDVDKVKPPDNIINNEVTRTDHAQFMTSLYAADEAFGEVIQALKRNNLYDDTLIIFTTDHGLANPFTKCNLYEAGTHVALMIRNPRLKNQGSYVHQMVSHLDVFPTICDILEIDKPNDLEGVSLEPILKGSSEMCHDYLFGEINFHTSYEPIRSVKTNRYKYIKYYDDYDLINRSNIDSSITKDFYMNNGLSEIKKNREQLFDLYYDPNEKNNLIDDDDYESIKVAMRNQLEKHLNDSDDYLVNGLIRIKDEWKVNKRECINASSKNAEDYVSLGR